MQTSELLQVPQCALGDVDPIQEQHILDVDRHRIDTFVAMPKSLGVHKTFYI